MDHDATNLVLAKALVLAGTVGAVVDSAAPTIFGYERALLIAGMVGVLMGVVYRKDFTWPAVLTGATSGISSVFYFAPFACELLAQRMTIGSGSTGFIYWISGLGGYYIVGHLTKALSDPLAALQAWWKIRNGGQP